MWKTINQKLKIRKRLQPIIQKMDLIPEADQITKLEARIDKLESKLNQLLTARSFYLGDYTAMTFLANGQRIFVDTRDIGIASHLLSKGTWEPHITKVFRDITNKGDTVLDVGANFGYYSLLANQLAGPKGKVFAFEANPHLCALLKKSLSINGFLKERRTEIFNKAVSDKNGTLSLKFQYEELGGGSFFKPKQRLDREDFETARVDAVALDDFFPQDLLVDVVKMDIEGSEPLAIRGMIQLIKRSPDIKIIMEFFPKRIENHIAPGEFVDLLYDLGFKPSLLTKEGVASTNRQGLLSTGNAYILLRKN